MNLQRQYDANIHLIRCMSKLDDELVKGCQRYLDTLKKRTGVLEQQKSEQRKVDEQKRMKREQWRKRLYEPKGQGLTVVVPDDSIFNRKGNE